MVLVKAYTPGARKEDPMFSKFVEVLDRKQFRKTFGITRKVRVPCEDLLPNVPALKY